MTYTSLHKIITGLLLQKKYPIHFYVDFLVYAQRGFEEIGFDSIANIRAVKLTVNSHNAVTLPDDFMDWCKVGLANGQFVQPLINRPSINRLKNFDTDGTTVIDYPSNLFDGFCANRGYTVRYNDNIEYTGRYYGGAVDRADSFKVLPERNQIQLHQSLGATSIILEYISDGSEVDNATEITPYAKSTIEAYISWKYKENGRSYSESERERAKQAFNQEHRKLRARMSTLTLDDIKASINRNTHGSIK